MFQAYEYFNAILPRVPSISKVYKVSGIGALEEVLSDLRNNPECALVIRDSGDGRINILDRRFTDVYHTIYVLVKHITNNHDSRLQAKRQAFNTGIALLDAMKADATDYGDPTHGFNAAAIDFAEIGPVGNNYIGYSFGFTIAGDL